MRVPPYRSSLLVLVLVGHLLWPDQTAIATAPTSSIGAGQANPPASVVVRKAPRKAARATTKSVRKKRTGENPAIDESPNREASHPTRTHTAQPQKTKKKLRPLAAVQPKPGLSYHGMLEQPRRYDPGHTRRNGAVPNPLAGDVLHDHFEELDKNRDGMIDPFERALGRLDIERDLTNRQWE